MLKPTPRATFLGLGLLVAGCGNRSPIEIKHDDTDWVVQQTDTQERLVLVGPSGDGKQVLAQSEGGSSEVLLAWDGSEWKPQLPNHGSNCVICRSPDSISIQGVEWHAANAGEVKHYDTAKSEWIGDRTGLTGDVLTVWGNDLGHIWAAGDGGGIARFDGTTWTPMTSPTKSTLRAMWGITASNIYAVGDGGTILHFDGAAWNPSISPNAETLRDVWGTSDQAAAAPLQGVFAVGDLGIIVHRKTF